MLKERTGMDKYALDVLGKTIGVVSNVKGTENIVIGTRQWLDEKADYVIVLLKLDIINTSFIKDSSFIAIADAIDEVVNEEICVNNKYNLFGCEIKEYTFPGNCIIVSEDNKRKNFVVCSQMDILMYHFKKLIKNIICDIYYEKGYKKIHASGVEKDEIAYLFIGNGFAGKSTTAFKLIEKGYNILNDDMLFLRINNQKLCVVGAPICCSLRDSARTYVDIELNEDNAYSSKYQETSYCYGMPFNKKEIIVDTITFLGDYEDKQKIECYETASDVIQVPIVQEYLTAVDSKLNLWKANKEEALSIIEERLK